jgi:hypothetical protein
VRAWRRKRGLGGAASTGEYEVAVDLLCAREGGRREKERREREEEEAHTGSSFLPVAPTILV